MIPGLTYNCDTDSELPELIPGGDSSWNDQLFFEVDETIEEVIEDLFGDWAEEPEGKALGDLKAAPKQLQQQKSGQGGVTERIAQLNFDEVLSIPNDRRISTLDPVWIDATLP